MTVRTLPDVVNSIGAVQGCQRLRLHAALEHRPLRVDAIADGLGTMGEVLRSGVGGPTFDVGLLEACARDHAPRVDPVDLRDAALAATRLLPDAPHVAFAVALATTATWMHHHGTELHRNRVRGREMLAWEVVPLPSLGWDAARVAAERQDRLGPMRLPPFGWDSVPHALALTALAVDGAFAAADLAAHAARVLGGPTGEYDPLVRPAWERYERLAAQARRRWRDELATLAWRLREVCAHDDGEVHSTVAALSWLLGRGAEWSAFRAGPAPDSPALPLDFWVELVVVSVERCPSDPLVQRAWLALKDVSDLDIRAFPNVFGVLNCVYHHPLEVVDTPWGPVADVAWQCLRAWSAGTLIRDQLMQLEIALAAATAFGVPDDLRLVLFWELAIRESSAAAPRLTDDSLPKLHRRACDRLRAWSFSPRTEPVSDVTELLVAAAYDDQRPLGSDATRADVMRQVVELQDALRRAAGHFSFLTTRPIPSPLPHAELHREREQHLIDELRGCRFVLGLDKGMRSVDDVTWVVQGDGSEGPSFDHDTAAARVDEVAVELEGIWDGLRALDPDYAAVRRIDAPVMELTAAALRAQPPAQGLRPTPP